MSWSMSAVGYPAAVIKRLEGEVARSKCAQPEETIRANVMENLKVALGAFPDTHPVRVEASGSQSSGPDGKFVNQLQVKVEPLWGFVTE